MERKSEFDDVGNFHAKFGFEQLDSPGFLDDEKMKIRLDFNLEELLETAEAAGFKIQVVGQMLHENAKLHFVREPSIRRDLAKFFDGLIDGVYVHCGFAWLCRLPWHEGWRRVHWANMKKERVMNARDSTRGTTFDVRKPDGWVAPSFDDILPPQAPVLPNPEASMNDVLG